MLSGFLVSGLIFGELLFGDTLLNVAERDSFGRGVLAEVLFFQNYTDGL